MIHELVHIGIEESIINRFKTPHGLKERIVDTFVYLNFHDLLPEYRIQEMGYEQVGNHLKRKEDLNYLDEIVQRILNEK